MPCRGELFAACTRKAWGRPTPPELKCGGKLKLVAFITNPIEAQRYLEHEGLPSTWPTIAPARAPLQFEMEFGEAMILR